MTDVNFEVSKKEPNLAKRAFDKLDSEDFRAVAQAFIIPPAVAVGVVGALMLVCK